MAHRHTLDDGIRDFSIHLANRPLANNTRKAFVGDVRIFARYLADKYRATGGNERVIAMVDVTTDDIAGFLLSLESGHIARSPKSLERRLTSLKVMFKWFYETGRLLRDPAESVAYKPFMDPLPEYLSEREATAVIEAARAVAGNERLEMRPLTAIMLVLDTGMKKGECLALTRDDITHNEDGSTAITVRYEQHHLQFKTRKLSISDGCRAVLDAHMRQYAPVGFLFDCTGRNLEYLFNRKVAPLANLSALTFEMLRWTSAVRDYRAGQMSADQLQVKYGLSDIGWAEMEAKLVRLTQHGPQEIHSAEQVAQ